MYGAVPSVGFRTTSTLVNPPTPRALLRPAPPALSTSARISRFLVIWNPVYSVSTREVACSASDFRLLGPLYAAGNDPCCCRIKLAWPEIQKRFQNKSFEPESG